MPLQTNMMKLIQVLCLALMAIAIPQCLSFCAESSVNLSVARQLNQAFVEVAQKVTPSVVIINVTQKSSSASFSDDENSGDFIPPELRHHLNDEAVRGQGSGIILREDGYILTNAHVVEEADKIEVRLHDGRVFKAQLRGADVQSDVAVIKIEAKNLPAAKLADSNLARVGEFAVAIGAPYSLDYSVTYGHVSAKGRSNILDGEENMGMDQDFLQTDANINPGNSGGPLVNIEGEVMGMNTLINGLRTGIGFAIPSNLAKEVAEQLIAKGRFSRPWLGVEIRALRDDSDLQSILKGVSDGVVIRAIRTNGPAANSELKPADIITAVDGKAVATPQELRLQIRSKPIGQTLMLDVFRQGKNLQLKLKTAEWVEPARAVFTKTAASTNKNPSANLLGLTVHAITHELA